MIDVRIAIALVLVALSPSLVAAQSPPPAPRALDPFDAFYDGMKDSTVKRLKENIKKVEEGAKEARRAARSNQNSPRAPSISTANASTAADIAQAAVSTNVTGADAGVSVSPLAFFGSQAYPVQPTVTLAALKDGITRYQLGASWQLNKTIELDLPACKLDETGLQKEMEDLRQPYRTACQEIRTLAISIKPAATAKLIDDYEVLLRANCGITGLPVRAATTLGTAVGQIIKSIQKLQEIYQEAAQASGEKELADQRNHIEAVLSRIPIDEMKKYDQPFLDFCKDEKTITDEIVRASWATPRMRFGISLRADLFSTVRGFNPDEIPKDIRRSDSEVRAEFSIIKGRWDATFGIGYGAARFVRTDTTSVYWAPSGAIAWTARSLTGVPLYKDNKLNVIDGALPPRLVLGLDVSLQYVPNKRNTEHIVEIPHVQRIAISGYADFRFSDKLTVRLGIPVVAPLAVRKENKDVTPSQPEKRDRQWTFPVFLATVIKI